VASRLVWISVVDDVTFEVEGIRSRERTGQFALQTGLVGLERVPARVCHAIFVNTPADRSAVFKKFGSAYKQERSSGAL
jgi:hypothetical protein